ncbi:MAG: hypothetical protein ACOCNI_04540 [Prevotella pectinovora]
MPLSLRNGVTLAFGGCGGGPCALARQYKCTKEEYQEISHVD